MLVDHSVPDPPAPVVFVVAWQNQSASQGGFEFSDDLF
jgi:hypothetical protein